jgi:hypothetical protein
MSEGLDVLDRDVRVCVYERFLAEGLPPTHPQVAEEPGGTGAGEVEASFRRLEAAHVLVLSPGTLDVWMAPPSAVPTDFRVETPRGMFFGNCVWDAFGVVAMLGDEGTISTHCPCCGEPMELRVDAGELPAARGVAHFAVPARRWWDDIGYT